MCSGGVVSKPQGEPGSKPAHNAHFLHSRVIGRELMSCVLGVVVSKPQGELGTKPTHNVRFFYWHVITLEQCKTGTKPIFPIPGHWLGAHVICFEGLMSKFHIPKSLA